MAAQRAPLEAAPVRAARPGLRRRGFDAVIAASGWVVLALDMLHGPVPLRLALVMAFAAFGPGLALRRFLPATSRLETLAYAIAASFSLGVFVTLGLALAHDETAVRALVILAAITSAAALADAVLRVPGERAAPARSAGTGAGAGPASGPDQA